MVRNLNMTSGISENAFVSTLGFSKSCEDLVFDVIFNLKWKSLRCLLTNQQVLKKMFWCDYFPDTHCTIKVCHVSEKSWLLKQIEEARLFVTTWMIMKKTHFMPKENDRDWNNGREHRWLKRRYSEANESKCKERVAHPATHPQIYTGDKKISSNEQNINFV